MFDGVRIASFSLDWLLRCGLELKKWMLVTRGYWSRVSLLKLLDFGKIVSLLSIETVLHAFELKFGFECRLFLTRSVQNHCRCTGRLAVRMD